MPPKPPISSFPVSEGFGAVVVVVLLVVVVVLVVVVFIVVVVAGVVVFGYYLRIAYIYFCERSKSRSEN